MASSRTSRGAPRLDVVVIDRYARPIVAAGLAAWLVKVAPATARGRVVIAVLPDAEVRRLNREYRRKDKATDVLSFPAGPHPADGGGRNVKQHKVLGDIAIAKGVATKQARALGHTLAVELKVLALHGLLHLLGYDHEADRGEMARTEDRLRRRGGLPTGLIGRTPGRH